VNKRRPLAPSGFTLVELLVVIAIIGVLVGLLLPAVQFAREAARAASCKNNLRQVALALTMHHDTRNRLPAGWSTSETNGWSWAMQALPFMEHSVLHKSIQRTLPVSDAANAVARTTVVPSFICPSDPGEAVFGIFGNAPEPPPGDETPINVDQGTELFKLARSSYVGNFGTMEIEDSLDNGDGIFYQNSMTRFANITDGLSNTVLVGERGSKLGSSTWTGIVLDANEPFARLVAIGDHTPNHPLQHFDDFSSHHVNGVHFALCDGSVRRIDDGIAIEVYQAMLTRKGKEVYSTPD
jgi:prepilin-type N-terminal cleavage/methylation domain-containing protein